MLEETGCDGILIGRGAMGNPWIFRQIRRYLEEGIEEGKPSSEEIISMLLQHAKLLVEANGELIGIRQMRSHAAWYMKGFPNAAKLRGRVNTIETLADLEALFS